MSNDVNFVKVLADNGIPTTQAELESKWRDVVLSTGSLISNDDRMSPFWRFVTAAVTSPVLWLVNFLAVTALPNAYVKYASGVFLDLLADAVNVQRKAATAATGVITFSRSSTSANATIPEAFVIQTAPIAGTVYAVQTTETKNFPPGILTVDVAVTAMGLGGGYNLAAGYYSVMPTPIPYVSAINGLNWLVAPGADSESDDELRQRVKTQFGTASKFHTDSVYRSLIATFKGVNADAIYFVHNAPRGPGTADAYVLFDFNSPVADYLAAINHYITTLGHHGHGDDLQVFQMPEQTVAEAVSIWVDPLLSLAQRAAIIDKVSAIIGCAFRENSGYDVMKTLPFSRFSFSKLSEEIHNLVPDIQSISFTSDDLVAGLWIWRLSSLTVTIEEDE